MTAAYDACSMTAIHITDIEAAINYWRGRAPSPDGVLLAPEVKALAEVYALMIHACESEDTFAKKYLLAGGDVFRLQKLMGHSDISVTKEYVEMFSEDLKMDYDRFNPLDNMIGNKQKIKMK